MPTATFSNVKITNTRTGQSIIPVAAGTYPALYVQPGDDVIMEGDVTYDGQKYANGKLWLNRTDMITAWVDHDGIFSTDANGHFRVSYKINQAPGGFTDEPNDKKAYWIEIYS